MLWITSHQSSGVYYYYYLLLSLFTDGESQTRGGEGTTLGSRCEDSLLPTGRPGPSFPTHLLYLLYFICCPHQSLDTVFINSTREMKKLRLRALKRQCQGCRTSNWQSYFKINYKSHQEKWKSLWFIKEDEFRTFLVVQLLGLCASTARGPSLIYGQGTKIPNAMQHGPKIFLLF